MESTISPRQLLVRLTAYFFAVIGGCVLLLAYSPNAILWLPVDGIDALETAQGEFRSIISSIDLGEELNTSTDTATDTTLPTPQQRDGLIRESLLIVAYVALSLLLTVAVMLPVTWTYMATRHESGYRKSFVRALIVLPVCATTIVLLIQNSLSLAFGLAALVAAVRFRVSLQDPIDGIYIFAAICVALAAGIGHLGIATVMAVFFCYASALLWGLDYGRNPLDDKRAARDRAKLDRPVIDAATGHGDASAGTSDTSERFGRV